MKTIIGRKEELEILQRFYDSADPAFLAVYGRRRIGKTFLINEFFKNKGVYFEVTGSRQGNRAEQLENFHKEFLGLFGGKWGKKDPKDWSEAFHRLNQAIQEIPSSQKVVLFLDELPWLSTPRSGFLRALDYYWNRHFSRRDNLILIICGSAASWMIQKVINDRGGLYGRLSAEICLKPFTLSETEEFLRHKGIRLNRKQIVEIYMAMGGIAKYLTYLTKGKSAAQLINELYFTPQGLLLTEFTKLYRSLFDDAEKHIRIVRALAKRRYGMTQAELLREVGMSTGGRATALLEELTASGFIMSTLEFGQRRKERKYRLIDEYSLFYLAWVEDMRDQILTDPESVYWDKQMRSQQWASWAGYAFETICLKHLGKIKQALGLGGVVIYASHWSNREKGRGAEIDLVVDRADQCINLCEIKFSKAEFRLEPSYAQVLERKMSVFREKTRTKKAIFQTMITPYGVVSSDETLGVVDNQILLDDLF